MKIAVLYICTGKYDIFLKFRFFIVRQKNIFVLLREKHYFVFTDSEFIASSENVSVIYQDNLGWPF